MWKTVVAYSFHHDFAPHVVALHYLFIIFEFFLLFGFASVSISELAVNRQLRSEENRMLDLLNGNKCGGCSGFRPLGATRKYSTISYICDADVFRYVCLFVLLFSVVVSDFCESLLFTILIALLKSNYPSFFSFFFHSRCIVNSYFINLICSPSAFSEIFTPFVSHQPNVMFAFSILRLACSTLVVVFIFRSFFSFFSRSSY